MIYKGTCLNVIDNTGAKKVRCFCVYRGQCAKVGDIIMVSVIASSPSSKIKKGTKHKALVTRTISPIRRANGTQLSFGDNAVVLLSEKLEPVGTRVPSLLPLEVPQKVRSLSLGVC